MLKWVQVVGGAWAAFTVHGVEIARLEVTSSTWKLMGRDGATREGSAGSIDIAKTAAISALHELLTTAMVDLRSIQQFSKRPPGWGG
jgi:hypothetical protein